MTFATAVPVLFTSFVYCTNMYWSVIHGIKRKPHLSVAWNWYHFVAIAILHQPRPTDSADINTRLQLSDTSSIPPMHGGFLLPPQHFSFFLFLIVFFLTFTFQTIFKLTQVLCTSIPHKHDPYSFYSDHTILSGRLDFACDEMCTPASWCKNWWNSCHLSCNCQPYVNT